VIDTADIVRDACFSESGMDVPAGMVSRDFSAEVFAGSGGVEDWANAAAVSKTQIQGAETFMKLPQRT